MTEDPSRYEEHIIFSYTRIPGKYESKDCILQIIFNEHFGPKFFYVLKLKNDGHLDWSPSGGAGFGIRNSYRGYVESICNILSVKYGKVFGYLGKLKDGDTYYAIDFTQPVIKYPYLLWNQQSNRIDIVEELNLVNVGKFSSELLSLMISKDEGIGKYSEIVSFYQKAIINSELDIEISYIDFIRTIEVFNSMYKISSDDELQYEGDLGKIWTKIAGDSSLECIFERFHGSTKKFISTILYFLPIDSCFWTSTESGWADFSLPKSSDDIKFSIKNAYAVRSKYIHEGYGFKSYILPDSKGLNEVINSEPASKSDLKIKKTLSLLGLERIIRAVLLAHFETIQNPKN